LPNPYKNVAKRAITLSFRSALLIQLSLIQKSLYYSPQEGFKERSRKTPVLNLGMV